MTAAIAYPTNPTYQTSTSQPFVEPSPQKTALLPVIAGGLVIGSGTALILESVIATGIVVVGTYVLYTTTKAIAEAISDSLQKFGKEHAYDKLTKLKDALMKAYAEGYRRFGSGSEAAYKFMTQLVVDWIAKPVGAPVVSTQPKSIANVIPASSVQPAPAATISSTTELSTRIQRGDTTSYKLYESIRQLDKWLTNGKGEGIGNGRVATGGQLMDLLKNMRVGSSPLNLTISVEGNSTSIQVAKTPNGGLAVTHGSDTFYVGLSGKGLDFDASMITVEAILTRTNQHGRSTPLPTAVNRVTPLPELTRKTVGPVSPLPPITVQSATSGKTFMGVDSANLRTSLGRDATLKLASQLPKHHGRVTEVWIQEGTGKVSLSPQSESAGWRSFLATVDNGSNKPTQSSTQMSYDPPGQLVLVDKNKKPPKDPNKWIVLLLGLGTASTFIGLWQSERHHRENMAEGKKTRDAIQSAEINRIKAQQDITNRNADFDASMKNWQRPAVFKDNAAKAAALLDMTKHYLAEGEKLMILNGIADGATKGDKAFLNRYRSHVKAHLSELENIVADVKAAKTPEEAAQALKSLSAAIVSFRPPSLPVSKTNGLYAENRDRPNEVANLITGQLVVAMNTKTISIATGNQVEGKEQTFQRAMQSLGEFNRATLPSSTTTSSSSSSSSQAANRAKAKALLTRAIKAAGLPPTSFKLNENSLGTLIFSQNQFISDTKLKDVAAVRASLNKVNAMIDLLRPATLKMSGDLRQEMIDGPMTSLAAISKALASQLSLLQKE